MYTRIGRMFLNVILACACAIGIAGLLAGKFVGIAEAQTAPAYGSCPSGMSRYVRLQANMQPMPSSCWLPQCKLYAPSPGHVTYAAKYISCPIVPGLPAAPQQPWCTAWLYTVAAAEAPAGVNSCPLEVQSGGSSNWVSN